MQILRFFKSTRAEMQHVTWPSRQHTILFTVMVILLSLVVGYLLGAFDLLFKTILKSVLI